MILSKIREMHPDWNVSAYCDDMREIVNCASCGQEIPFGGTYISHMQTSDRGVFGLAVCPKCYRKELREIVRGKSWNESEI